MCVCARACVCVRVRVCVYVCVKERVWEGEGVGGSEEERGRSGLVGGCTDYA